MSCDIVPKGRGGHKLVSVNGAADSRAIGGNAVGEVWTNVECLSIIDLGGRSLGRGVDTIVDSGAATEE